MNDKQEEHIKDLVEESVVESIQEAIQEIQDGDAPVYATVEKKTPGRHDISWWIKWVSAIMLIIGGLLIQSDILLYGTIFATIGTFGWIWVGMLWNDHAIIIMNALFFGMYLLSITTKLLAYLPI